MDSFASTEPAASGLYPMLPERRGEARQTTLLRVGKLVTAEGERLCMVRNLSSAGAMLRLYQPLGVGAAIEVEVCPDCRVPATVIWAEDDLAGIVFDQPIDVAAALRGTPAGLYRRVARTPRLQVFCPARLCTDDFEAAATLCDISLKGARIAIDDALGAGTEAAIFVDGLPPLTGRVRWCHHGNAGIEFDLPLAMDRLADWLGKRGRPDD